MLTLLAQNLTCRRLSSAHRSCCLLIQHSQQTPLRAPPGGHGLLRPAIKVSAKLAHKQLSNRPVMTHTHNLLIYQLEALKNSLSPLVKKMLTLLAQNCPVSYLQLSPTHYLLHSLNTCCVQHTYKLIHLTSSLPATTSPPSAFLTQAGLLRSP